MARGLGDFLDQARKTPFAWGRFDCILWLADWSATLGAGDPGKPWRGRYRTALGAIRIVNRAAGMAGLVDREFGQLGWVRTETATPGAIAIVKAMTDAGEREVGAIRTGDKWAALGKAGLLIGPFQPTAMWEHPWQQQSSRT